MKTLFEKTMMTLPALAVTTAVSAADPLVMDFDEGVETWRIVVDGVMGGRSSGRVSLSEPGILQFTGDLSLENNGGFSQMRTNVPGNAFAGAQGIEIKVRGDGRTYKFDVRCSNVRLMAGGFQQDIQTEDGAWTTVRLPFDGFRLYSFGRRVPNAPALEPTKIESIGVTLADKKAGAFRLEVASIRAYDDRSSANRAARLTNLQEKLAGAEPSLVANEAPVSHRAEGLRLMELAIQRGVPLFNEGQTEACATIYEVTIEAMLAFGAERLEKDVVRRLETGLAEAESDHSSRARAWTYRRALDDAYARLSRQAELTTTASR